ncbi:hypothetical protein [Streptomyces sp. enrichment culture]|uniref:hypothetical protein n=1 Tax=Streptomyces sp. enrichment culture TaxID=1795815 RepID=UPI003F56E63A
MKQVGRLLSRVRADAALGQPLTVRKRVTGRFVRARRALFAAHSARTVVVAFAAVVVVGTALPALPLATKRNMPSRFGTALHTATSASA